MKRRSLNGELSEVMRVRSSFLVFPRLRHPVGDDAHRRIVQPQCICHFLEGIPVNTNGLIDPFTSFGLVLAAGKELL